MVFSLIAILIVVGGAVYFVHKDWQPESDAKVAAMPVTYRCTKCGKTFQLTISEAGQMRRYRGDIVCPACGALGAEKQDVAVVVSGDEAPNTGESVNQASHTEPKAQPTLTRTLDRP